ncbi:MAG TPA: hypothetical protein PK987_06865 [Ferruginibacter sp.]|nr:hypothetical protein [Ferruginibacter sp.]
MNKNVFVAFIYFALSTGITWWFVDACPLYTSLQQKILSIGIAGAKWGLQIGAAYFFLAEKKWSFIKNIGFTCTVGSFILLPYPITTLLFKEAHAQFFIGSLIVAVIIMIVLYFLSVKKLAIPVKWFWGWMGCLAIAIILQLTIVFEVIKF